MNRAHGAEITIDRLNKELESLKKKIFTYETLNSEKEIKKLSTTLKADV